MIQTNKKETLTLFGVLWSLYALLFPLSTQIHSRINFGGFYFHPCLAVPLAALLIVLPTPKLVSVRNIKILLFNSLAYLLILLISGYVNGILYGYPLGQKIILKFIFFFFTTIFVVGTIKKRIDVSIIIQAFSVAMIIIAIYGFWISITGRTDNPTNPFYQVGVKNAFGIWLGGYFILALYLINNSKNIVVKITWVIGLFIVLFVQVFTLSRSGWFMICLNFLLFAIGMKKGKSWIYAILLVTASLYVAEKYIPKAYINQAKNRYESISTKNKLAESSKGRLVYFYKTFVLVQVHPILGIGPNNFQRYNVYVPFLDRLDTNVSHNIFLNVIVETGFIGVFVVGLLFRKLILLYRKAKARIQNIQDQQMFNCLWLSVVLFLIEGLFTEEVLFVPSFGLVLGLAIAYSCVLIREHSLNVANAKYARQ
jgi:O-antigen ligase